MSSIIKNNENTTLLINYLKRMSEQYPVLSAAQERELIEKYKNDRSTLNHLLFMHNIKLVFSFAKNYMLQTNDFDGMIQDGMVGLAEAARRFEPEKGTRFNTYATTWIKKHVLKYFYSPQCKLDKASMSLQDINTNVDSDSKEVTFESYINEYIDKSYDSTITIDKELSANEQVDLCNKLMEHLNDDTELSATDKDIFYKLFYNREKPKLLATEYNLSVGYINHLRSKILSKFKDILVNDYNIKSYQDILIS